MKKTTAFSARVQGKVQGVGFRYSALREAERLRLGGFVKNTNRGDVEIWAEGPPDKLALFLKWLNRGPQFSRVDNVEKEDTEALGYSDFRIEH